MAHSSPQERQMRPQDWAFLAAVAAAIFAITAALRGALYRAFVGIVMTAAGGWVSHALSHRYPGPMPGWFRWGLLFPRGFHSPGNLRKVLQPRTGERILELGPGIGAHSLPVAASLTPAGRLDVLDIQQAMLNQLIRRAGAAGITNIHVARGDGQRLPYASRRFDAAYMIDVLGEVPDLRAVLEELQRALRTGGRLVVGEHFLDPDFVSLRSLRDNAESVGFSFEGKKGTSLVYFARFRPK